MEQDKNLGLRFREKVHLQKKAVLSRKAKKEKSENTLPENASAASKTKSAASPLSSKNHKEETVGDTVPKITPTLQTEKEDNATTDSIKAQHQLDEYHQHTYIRERKKRKAVVQNTVEETEASGSNFEETVTEPTKKPRVVERDSNKGSLILSESKKVPSKIIKKVKKTLICIETLPKLGESTVKPDWGKIKKRSLELKKERKTRKLTNFEKVVESKKLWEEARKEKCSPDKKAKLIVSMYNLIRDDITKVVYTHDTSRIIQFIIKVGTPLLRSSIFDALKPILIDMLQKKFSSHVIKELLKCDKECGKNVLRAIQGNVVKLMTNSIAAPIVEYGYSTCATTELKRSMELEYYGTSSKIATGREFTDLKSILEVSSELKNSVLEEIQQNILKSLDKGQSASSLLHAISLQFLEFATPAQKEEILMAYHKFILDLIRTKAGARISMQCCWYLNKKVKKSIVKSIKGRITNICNSDEGYWLILALLDSVDDTVLLKKVIISEIMDNVMTIVKHEKGRKVILYLVVHRDTTYFHPNDLELLKTADTCGTVMKSISTRRSEILQPVLEALYISVSSNVRDWFQESSVAMVLLAVLKSGEGSAYKVAVKTAAEYVCKDIKVPDGKTKAPIPLVEHSGYNHVLKKLLKSDVEKQNDEDMFAFHLANALTPVTMRKWIMSNRGCFLLSSILETKNVSAINFIKDKLNRNMMETIKSSSTAGGKVLSVLLLPTGVESH